ncbi:MAG TPA: TetR/AcrR family transcriptional regulator [Candidatus Acidoferrales bacterium]|nr:TetR/AcrR family transcriptional regulator [Candidatus Acidoferrales bacterium]
MSEVKMTMEGTRNRILHAAFDEFHRNGFHGGSLNHIVENAGTTKGALFHYFKSKTELGYAIVEEVIQPMGKPRWIDPLNEADDPVDAIKKAFRRSIREDAANIEMLGQGCPLNNLAQEMSPLDEGFRKRIEHGYEIWREALADALDRAKERGQIKKSVATKGVAALIVACQMGIWGSAKNSRNAELMIQAGEALCGYLDSLKP